VPLDRVQRRSTQLFARLTDWTTRVDETSGATYYYNEETGESQWEPPQAAVAQQDDGGQSDSEKPKPLWSFVGSSGTVVNGYRHVDYNLRKHDVQVLSRFNMLQQRLTVSRKQCLVSCLADGSATLTSVGRGATLWREQGGPWCSVQMGEGLVLSDGDQVSLDCNDPNEVVFTCQQKCAAQQGGSQQGEGGYQQGEGGYQQGGRQSASQQSGYQQEAYAQQAPPQQASPQLPCPWEQLADQNGAVYYSNPQTGEAQWEAPQLTPQQGQGEYREYPQQDGY